MRSKEEAYDYRYFPEPDLVPLDPPAEWQAQVRQALPALPAERRAALADGVGVPAGDPAVGIVVALDLDGLVVAAVAGGADPRLALNRAANEVAAAHLASDRVDVTGFTTVLAMEAGGRLTPTQARQVLAQVLSEGGDPEDVARARGFEAVGDDDLAELVDGLVAQHPAEWARLRGGDQKLFGYFVGKVMAATKGNADGKAVTALLRQRAAGG